MARRNRGRSGAVIRGPLAPFAGDYEIQLRARGYSSRSVVCEVRYLARLSQWMENCRLNAADLNVERIDEFLGGLPRRRDGGRVCSRRGLIQILGVLDDRGVRCPQAEKPASPSEVLLASFERFLLQERAVAPSTAVVYVARARRFLDWCAPNAELGGLTANDVINAVLRVSASASPSTTKLFVTAAFVPAFQLCRRADAERVVRGGTFCSQAAPIVAAHGDRQARRRCPASFLRPAAVSWPPGLRDFACPASPRAAGRGGWRPVLAGLRLAGRRGDGSRQGRSRASPSAANRRR